MFLCQINVPLLYKILNITTKYLFINNVEFDGRLNLNNGKIPSKRGFSKQTGTVLRQTGEGNRLKPSREKGFVSIAEGRRLCNVQWKNHMVY